MACHWVVISLPLLLIGSNFFAVSSIEVSFSGRDYIEYDLNEMSSMDSVKTEIELHFKTIHPNGLLLFSKGTTNDFLQLELKEGTIRYSANLGGLQMFKMSLGEKLHDAKWHSVRVTRLERMTTLEVNQARDTGLTEENFKELNLNTKMYVGGLKGDRDLHITGTQNYKGCMKDVIFENINLLQGAKDNIKNFKKYGKPEFKCTSEKYVPITFRSSESYVKVTLSKLPRDNNSFSTSFKFRTFLEDGSLFSRSAIRVKFHIELRGGALFSEVLTPNGTKTFLRLGSRLDDGEWHSVNASVNGKSGKLQVSLDDHTQSETMNKSSIMLAFANKSLLKIFAGKAGQDSKRRSFVGCMLNLKVDSHHMSLKEVSRRKSSRGTTAGECKVTNHCFPDPCNNRGRCSHDGWKFVCDCNERYEGNRCEKIVYEATCEVYKHLGLRRDTYCLLDSDQSGNPQPYTAWCNVTGDMDRTYTVISHNEAMKKTRISTGKIAGSSRFIQHDITYSVPMNQIIALMQKSKECRQYIKYDCYNSKLLNSRGSRLKGSQTHAYWRTRNNSMQFYWGGAPPESGKCACGVTNSCVDSSTYCNCDSRSNDWLVDDGYLTDTSALPVKQLAFRNKSAGSFYTLGPLECWGTKTSRSTRQESNDHHAKKKKLLRVCPIIVPPTTATTAATTEQTSTVQPSSQEPCILPEGRDNHACPSHYPSTTGTAALSTDGEIFTESNAVTIDRMGAQVSEKQKDSTAEDGLSTALTALLSCSLVVVLLLAVKFGLPRVIVCIRTHSKRGEYVVPPVGVGYPARLMPLMTGRKASARGRLTHNHVEKHLEGNGAAGGLMKSYWV